ncbi:MAG: 50S ribosomal protein L21 [Candidatus Portnoybacteria bacterium]|nr:50S ribosomal protein L21 [Candidatus Portnoybacteria bacterium]
MKLAVIRTGGKQYIVSPKQKIEVEKLEGKEGGKVSFDEVLLLSDGQKVAIGQPKIAGVKISGKIVKQGRDKKVIVFKYKSKKRYQVKRGHRQAFSLVEIDSFGK